MMKTFLQRLVASSFAILVLSNCGSSSTSVNPLDVLDPNSTTPQLSGIVASGTYNSTLYSGFTDANPYWTFYGGFTTSGTAGNFVSPARGYVSRIGTATLNGSTVTYVTLVHSGRLSTRVFGMQVVQVREGDTVSQGSVIGSFLNSGYVAFQVLWDATAVCPLSYMSSAFRTSISNSGSYFTQLCP